MGYRGGGVFLKPETEEMGVCTQLTAGRGPKTSVPRRQVEGTLSHSQQTKAGLGSTTHRLCDLGPRLPVSGPQFPMWNSQDLVLENLLLPLPRWQHREKLRVWPREPTLKLPSVSY